jgi:hypothetical protein
VLERRGSACGQARTRRAHPSFLGGEYLPEDVDGMLGFFTGISVFYPRFDALLRSEVRARYASNG